MARPFNLICNTFSNSIKVNGRTYIYFTNTAVCMDCMSLLQDPSVNDDIKAEYLLDRFYSSNVERDDRGMAFQNALNFLKGAPTPEYEKVNIPSSGECPIYWDLDSPAIYASFRQAYGITLEEIRRLHWWEFLALLYNIPSETRMGTLFATRSKVVDTSLKPKDQLREREIKKGARPKDTRTREEKQKDAMKTLASALL